MEYYQTKTLALKLRSSPHLVKVMQKMGLKGVKIGNKWYFSERQVERFFDAHEEDMIDLLRNIDVD